MHGVFKIVRAGIARSENIPTLFRCGPGIALVLAISAELRRANAATHRYEQLKRMASAHDHPAVNTARRIYVELYSDE